MQMKKIISLTHVMGMGMTILFGSACNKLVEIPQNTPGQLTTSQVFSDSAATVSAVAGIYLSLFGTQGPLTSFMSVYPSLSADDLVSYGTDPFSSNALIAGNTAQGPGGSTGMIWKGFYNSNLIYQANADIEGITGSTSLSPALKDQLIGECEVVRALSYFYLVNLYGPVPLALGTDYKVNSTLPRAPVDTVYEQITRDLVDAGNRLVAGYPSAGRARPNKFTAMALLSRVYLYRRQWDKAQATADVIIGSGNYHLKALDSVFLIGSQEAIWQAVSLGYYNYAAFEGIVFVPYSPDIIPPYYLTANLVKTFEPGDQRASHWTAASNVGGVNYYYPYKYKNSYAGQVNGTVEGEVLFRLAEQYLIRAEAKIQLGDLSGGAQDINMIRTRAGLPNTGATSGADLLQAIAHERQAEFFCEWGHRWLDLKRTGAADSVMTREKGGLWPADGHAALYPVPNDQFILNPGWKQNSGY
jgi:hypothetical protein